VVVEAFVFYILPRLVKWEDEIGARTNFRSFYSNFTFPTPYRIAPLGLSLDLFD
jgi:hypothetical protein